MKKLTNSKNLIPAINLNIQTMTAIETILPWNINNVLTKRGTEFIITDLVIHYNHFGDLPNVYKANEKKFDNEITPLVKAKLAYNRKGATYSKNDDIWIDCFNSPIRFFGYQYIKALKFFVVDYP